MRRPYGIVLIVVILTAVPAFVASSRAGLLGWGGPADSTVVRSVRESLDVGAVESPHGERRGLDPRLTEFYRDSTAAVLWVAGSRPSRAARGFLEALGGVDREGLDPEAFGLSDLREAFRLLPEHPTASEAGRTEVLASDAFLRLADALARGVGEPDAGGLHWELERDSAPGPEILGEIARGSSPEDVLDRLRPTLPWYGRLIDALDRYRALAAAGGWPTVTGVGDPVARGDSARLVAEVRERLRAGADPRERALASRSGGPPEVFDDGLARAVSHFQARHGIEADSVVGPETVKAMGTDAERRVAELRLNLDRLRRMPRSLGERAILVNVAGFELLVLEHQRPVLSMGVVVGQPDKRTSVFTADLRYVVFNPYWRVPRSIAREEIVPAVWDDPSYLEANHLRVVPADDPTGPPVSPDNVDWSQADAEDWPYTFRQDPGPENALGRIKFMLPNEHDIYLHDTPADHLFSRSFRAFSHGCIRVERPRELARYVLRNGADRPPEDVETLLESGENRRVDLDRPLPVFITYLTAWVDEDGTVRFYQDPYGLDDLQHGPAVSPAGGETTEASSTRTPGSGTAR